jgi:hypothetical protein
MHAKLPTISKHVKHKWLSALLSLLVAGQFPSSCFAESIALTTPNSSYHKGCTTSTKSSTSSGRGESERSAESYLIDGDLPKNELLLRERLKGDPKNDNLRFSLGILQFLEAVSQLIQSIHYYGMRDYSHENFGNDLFGIPFAHTDSPHQISYVQARDIAANFIRDLQRAESTLAAITDRNVRLPVHFGQIRLNLTQQVGEPSDQLLWKLYSKITHTTISPEDAKDFIICFDDGDVHWLRGYCNLLTALGEIYLAYDSQETFNCTAHLIFAKVDSPYKFLQSGKKTRYFDKGDAEIVDLISLIHTIRWPLKEPARLKSAFQHLKMTIHESKVSWSSIQEESDDDHEWLPNPEQTGVIPGVSVQQGMIDSWLEMMDQADKVLDGKLLIPFWRSTDGSGVNLKKVFLQPRNLDLVLWVQGPAALPYIEKGALAKPEPWLRLPREFGSQLPGFAVWFN